MAPVGVLFRPTRDANTDYTLLRSQWSVVRFQFSRQIPTTFLILYLAPWESHHEVIYQQVPVSCQPRPRFSKFKLHWQAAPLSPFLSPGSISEKDRKAPYN